MGQVVPRRTATTPAEEHSFRELLALLPEALQRDELSQRRDDLEHSNAALTRVLADVRHRFNALAPIDRLPPEMFRYIFEFVVQASDDRTFWSCWQSVERIPSLRQVHALTSVSRRWRAIALKTPALWTHVDNRNVERLEAYLERSASMPLTLHLPVRPTARVEQLLEKHGHRVRRLDYVEQHRVIREHCPPTDLLPNLDCLTVSSDCDRLWDYQHETINSVHGVCLLKALALQPICTAIPGDSFPHLTHLYLSPFHERTHNEDAIHYLTSILSATPVLRHLHLSDLYPDSVNTWAIDTPIALSSLRSLTCLNSDLAASLRLLELLELPEDVLVRLDGLLHYDPNTEEGHLPRALPSQSFVASFKHLEVFADAHALHVVAQGSRSGLWVRADTMKGDPDDHTENFWSPWITALQEMLPLASIKTLHISVLDATILPALLPQLPNLVELAVRIQPGTSQLCEWQPCWTLLSWLYRALADSAGRALCCPKLECLAIDLPSEISKDFCAPGAPSLSKGYALRMTEARAEAGKPLQCLAIQPRCDDGPECHSELLDAFASIVAAFNAHVAHVKLVQNSESVLCPFRMRDMWNVDGVEEYWGLSPVAEMPEYSIPWD